MQGDLSLTGGAMTPSAYPDSPLLFKNIVYYNSWGSQEGWNSLPFSLRKLEKYIVFLKKKLEKDYISQQKAGIFNLNLCGHHV